MNRSYVLVGANSSIAEELTRKLLADNNQVIALSRSKVNIEDNNLLFRQFDPTNFEQKINIEVDKIDGLIYFPGSISLKPFHRISLKDFQEDLNINLLGAINSIQQFLPLLKKSESSSIVLFSTVAVALGMPFHSSIASAKGAIEGLTRSLAAELSPLIRVNAIAPSLTKTKMAEKLVNTTEKEVASAQRHPLNRVGTPEEIANLAEFLLTEKSSWITGQIINIDGGMGSIKKI